MSLDYLQNRQGLLQMNALPVAGSTGTASTIISNQYPAGFEFGQFNGFMAGSNSTNGGALVISPIPRAQATTDFQSFATTGVISHDNAPLALVSVSTTGIALNLQQALSHGQIFEIAMFGTTGSVVSTLNTSGFGATTTAAVKVLDAAFTLASTQSVKLVALAQLGGTATTNTPYVWHRLY